MPATPILGVTEALRSLAGEPEVNPEPKLDVGGGLQKLLAPAEGEQPPLKSATNPEPDMTNKTLNTALDFTQQIEGGFVNDPDDKGGATNRGVTLKTLRQHKPEATIDDLKALTADEAREIFRTDYVTKPGIDKLPDVAQAEAVALSVHAGPDRAIKVLQKAAGVEADGVLGPKSVAAIAKLSNEELRRAIMDYYVRIVEKDPTQIKFLRGWLKRNEMISSIPEDKE